MIKNLLNILICCTCMYAWEKTGIPLVDSSASNLPSNVLAFPYDDNSWMQKIDSQSGDYIVYSETDLKSWSAAQGYQISSDDPGGGWNYHRAAVIKPPGLIFRLFADTSRQGKTGWMLILDLAELKPVSKDRKNSGNIEVLKKINVIINSEYKGSLITGFEKYRKGPYNILVPYIQNETGELKIELKTGNMPDSEIIIYDARIEKQ